MFAIVLDGWKGNFRDCGEEYFQERGIPYDGDPEDVECFYPLEWRRKTIVLKRRVELFDEGANNDWVRFVAFVNDKKRAIKVYKEVVKEVLEDADSSVGAYCSGCEIALRNSLASFVVFQTPQGSNEGRLLEEFGIHLIAYDGNDVEWLKFDLRIPDEVYVELNAKKD